MRVASGLRPEIQALRALAVLAVVLYHLWPVILTGGFVGVDVFFVVSGFLITSHLLREHTSTGTIRLGRFWARRARRLLPAALLVIALSGIAVVAIMPQLFWAQFFREAIASAVYVENWVLAGDAVNYLAAHNSPSALQHYWSLSVEEQFYVVWPLLLIGAGLLARRVAPQRGRLILAMTLGVVTVASLAYSVLLTSADPSAAYFVTPTRAWEFGIGGLLAFVPVVVGVERVRSAVAWLGWIAIVLAIVKYSAGTPFPGYTALLPVLGTAAVIWAGSPRPWWSPRFVASLPPVQFVGGISYSLYLWHWPLIIIAPYVLGYPQLAIVEKSALLVLSIALAWLTKRFVEDPVRVGRLAQVPSRWTALAAIAGMAIIVIPSLLGGAASAARLAADDAQRAQLSTTPCFGAASLDPALDCADATYPVLSPDPAVAPEDVPTIFFADPPCFAGGTEVRVCSFGAPDATLRIALVGDSHAAQWQPALEAIALSEGWRLDTYLKTNCAFSDAKRTAQYDPCTQWSAGVEDELAGSGPYDLVITSFFAENLGLEVDAGAVSRASAITGFHDVWQPLIDGGSTVVALADTPHLAADVTVCVALHPTTPARCSASRDSATAREDLQVTAADGFSGAASIDMVDWFCGQSACEAVIGGVVVHTDPFHITQTYASTMAPYLLRELRPLLG
ncbi:MAG: acyltransferase [Salinibacterium sp.]|nr:acyltransferase [Salinibacterium sp.]